LADPDAPDQKDVFGKGIAVSVDFDTAYSVDAHGAWAGQAQDESHRQYDHEEDRNGFDPIDPPSAFSVVLHFFAPPLWA